MMDDAMYFILFQNTDTLEHMPLIGPFTNEVDATRTLDGFSMEMDDKDEFTAVYGGEVVSVVSPSEAVAKYIELIPGFGQD